MSDTVNVCLVQSGNTASKGEARNHTLIMDRSEAKGGENAGPMGGEVFLLALGGCFMSNLRAAVAARDTKVENIRLDIRGTLDGNPTRFSAAEIRISADYDDRAGMEKLVSIAKRGCIVGNTLKPAVDLSISLTGETG